MGQHIRDATVDDLKSDDQAKSHLSFTGLASTITISDNHEKLVDQKVIESNGLLCAPFWATDNDLEGDCYRDYIQKHPDFTLQLRTSVVDKLLVAQSQLPSTLRIRLRAGYRPYEVQLSLLRSFMNDIAARQPQMTHDELLDYTRAYVADPSIECPPHVTGGAVDIDIIDTTTGTLIDMGCAANTDGEIAYLHSALTNDQQRRNRQVLLDAMLEAGFCPLANEWWHYQYGETNWAAFYGQSSTLYGLIT